MQFVGGIVVGGIIVAIFAAAIHDFSDVRDWPNWAQACVAALALIIAIYIPWQIDERQRKRAKEEAGKKALSLAYLLKPELDDVIFWAGEHIDTIKSDEGFLGPNYINQNVLVMKRWKIDVTPVLESGVLQVHLFPEALAEAFVQMMAEVRKLNRHVDDTVEGRAPALPTSYYRELLEGILERAAKAHGHMRLLLEKKL